MKILWITNEYIYPPNSGGKSVIFNRIKYLSKDCEIYLFSLYDNNLEDSSNFELLKYCKVVKAYRREKGIKTLIKSIFLPYSVVSRKSKQMKLDIIEIINKEKIDLINIEFPQVVENIKGISCIPMILNQHNIEYLALKSIANTNKRLIKKIIYYYEAIKMFIYEKNIYKKNNFKLFTFVSDKDEVFFKKKYNKENTIITPIGANVKFSILKNKKRESNNIIFTGTMSYQPNIDAVIWFTHKVLPKIKKKINDVKFYIVGNNPSKEVINLENEDIIVTGKVKNMKEYFEISDLYVIPLKSGGGVKVKLIEAASYSQTIVSTSKGIEGTKFENKKNIIIANEDLEFAECCIEILENKDKYLEIGSNARKIVEEIYSWENICKEYLENIKKVVGEVKK